jgi:hypothetical protein
VFGVGDLLISERLMSLQISINDNINIHPVNIQQCNCYVQHMLNYIYIVECEIVILMLCYC